MAEWLWEQGQSQCVNYPIDCRTRPCTAAQDVFCCRACNYSKTCTSRCRIGEQLNEKVIREV